MSGSNDKIDENKMKENGYKEENKDNEEKFKKNNMDDKSTTDEIDILFDNYIFNNIQTVKYTDVGDYFLEHYTTNNTNNSNIIDVIGIYIKGQKILYTEAKTTCEQRLTFLMLPSILFTILSSIINLLIDDMRGKIITTGLNGIITFILTVINYLKLDARAEAHRSSAYKYDKLLTYIEFQSCKQLFFDSEKAKMKEVISKIENDVKDIKETNQFVLPEIIRYNFPLLSNINIFSEVKKILNKEMINMNKLANILNDIRILETQLYRNNTIKEEDKIELKINLEIKKTEKQDLTNYLLKLQQDYITLDKEFKVELEKYSLRNKYRIRICDWLKV